MLVSRRNRVYLPAGIKEAPASPPAGTDPRPPTVFRPAKVATDRAMLIRKGKR